MEEYTPFFWGGGLSASTCLGAPHWEWSKDTFLPNLGAHGCSHQYLEAFGCSLSILAAFTGRFVDACC